DYSSQNTAGSRQQRRAARFAAALRLPALRPFAGHRNGAAGRSFSRGCRHSLEAAWIEDAMHKVDVRQEIVDRVLARRGRYHWFEELDPRRTALVVIDMQEAFCAPGAPAEDPNSRA